MLKHLDENEKQWQRITDEEISHSRTEKACDSFVRKVTSVSIEAKKVSSATEVSLPVVDSVCDTSVQSVDDDSDESEDCCTVVPSRVESRRGSLPTCDAIPVFPAAPRRNSAPVISQCAAVTVKKYLLATLAEHSSSVCSTESEHLFPSSNYTCRAPEALFGKFGKQSEHDRMLPRRAPGAKKSAWTAVSPLNTGNAFVSIEGRPRDRRSNSHALVFRQCLLAGRIPGRRFSSPAVGQDHWMNRDSESVPLLSPVIPSSTICSHSALVNWFVVLFFCDTKLVIINILMNNMSFVHKNVN